MANELPPSEGGRIESVPLLKQARLSLRAPQSFSAMGGYRNMRRAMIKATPSRFLLMAWLAIILILLSACSSGLTQGTTPGPVSGSPCASQGLTPLPNGNCSSANATPSPTSTPTGNAACAVPNQTPPSGNISAAFATALAFAPDGRLFWAEREGKIKVWQNGAAHTFATVDTVTTEKDGNYSERGLLGLAISPTFDTDRFVYAFYSDSNYTQEHILRWSDCQGKGTHPTVLVTLPSGSDCCHKGGRLAFGKDGMLYVTVGDEHTSSAAQQTDDVRGKVLRYRPDGKIPSDNPFGPKSPVWAYGLRNPFGIAVSSSGQIAITSNGPTGDADSPPTGYDTVILNLVRGGGYQWPECYGYSHPQATSPCPSKLLPPDYSTEKSTLVPTGAAFIDASGPSQFANHLVFCTLNGGMRILTLASPHATIQSGPSGCLLDVKEGPDHAIYFSDTSTIHRAA